MVHFVFVSSRNLPGGDHGNVFVFGRFAHSSCNRSRVGRLELVETFARLVPSNKGESPIVPQTAGDKTSHSSGVAKRIA
jgi:hypothetical protein